jgi:hypothetical protein
MTEEVTSSVLLQDPTRLEWYNVWGHYSDDHKLERTPLQKHLRVFYVRKKENPEQMYVAKEGSFDRLECLKCGTAAERAEVVHEIRHERLSLLGTEKNQYENVPYCPACERKPDPNGTLIGENKKIAR